MVLAKSEMKLKNLIFADGFIQGLRFENSTLDLKFRDYLGYINLIRFSGDVNYEENDCVGTEVISSKLSKIKKNRFRLVLSDDEGITLKIEFGEAVVEEL